MAHLGISLYSKRLMEGLGARSFHDIETQTHGRVEKVIARSPQGDEAPPRHGNLFNSKEYRLLRYARNDWPKNYVVGIRPRMPTSPWRTRTYATHVERAPITGERMVIDYAVGRGSRIFAGRLRCMRRIRRHRTIQENKPLPGLCFLSSSALLACPILLIQG